MPLQFGNIEEMIRYLDAKALEHALTVYQIVLDHSSLSIQNVERILSRLHEHHLSSRSLEGLFGIAMFYGAYVGEVIRRNDIPAAKWVGEVSGRVFPSLTWSAKHGGSSVIFPMSWCYARMVDGPADNVSFKYEACVRRDDVLIETLKYFKGGENG